MYPRIRLEEHRMKVTVPPRPKVDRLRANMRAIHVKADVDISLEGKTYINMITML